MLFRSKLKNISPADYARHHPGGQLGRRLLLTVEDVMRKGERNPTIRVENSVRDMLARITEGQAGAISVVNSRGQLVGLVSDYDVRKALESSPSLFDLHIRDIMNPTPLSVQSHQLASDALELMRSRKKPTAVLPVIDARARVVGMLHIMDLVSAGL